MLRLSERIDTWEEINHSLIVLTAFTLKGFKIQNINIKNIRAISFFAILYYHFFNSARFVILFSKILIKLNNRPTLLTH